MKGFIACVLALAPRFVQGTRGADARPIHIAISYDEEIGCVGVRGLLDQLARDAVRPTGCIIGEPTMMRIATAHKGKSAWRCTVLGQAAHSSQPQQGVNAIEYAAELIMFLRQRGRDWQEGVSDTRYEPAWSTVQTGTVRGGAVVNVVPDRCEFDFEIRPLPGSDHHLLADELGHFARRQIMPQMRRVAGDANIQLGGAVGLSWFAGRCVAGCAETPLRGGGGTARISRAGVRHRGRIVSTGGDPVRRLRTRIDCTGP